MTMHILLIEASLTGHHSIYLEKCILANLAKGNKITVALPINITNKEDLSCNLRTCTGLNWVEYNPDFNLNQSGFSGLAQREYSTRKSFGKIYKDVHKLEKVDYVFLPYIDYCLYAIGLLGSPFGETKFGGICMRPSFHYRSSGVVANNSKIDHLKKILFIRTVRNKFLEKLFSIDDLLIGYLKSNLNNIDYSKLGYIPDPVDNPIEIDTTAVRRDMDTPKDAKVILIYGAIDERKGITLILDALESSSELQEWHVWLIGKQSDDAKTAIASSKWGKLKSKNRIKSLDQYVTNDFGQIVLAACDVVWLVYQNHYAMSGVMVHAGRNRKPTISCNVGLIGWFARKFDTGIPIENTICGVQNALHQLSSLNTRNKLGIKGNEVFADHTWQNFSLKISA